VSCRRQILQSDWRSIDPSRTISDYLADSVDAFLTYSESSAAVEGEDLPLGLTFSFPVEQTALDSGNLLTWTKGTAQASVTSQAVVDSYPRISQVSLQRTPLDMML
jgi:hexokinase